MPLLKLPVRWVHGLLTYPPVGAKILRDVGGYLCIGGPLTGARVYHHESFGSYPWRVSLATEHFTGQVQFEEVDDFATFREALAAASRFVRKGLRAVEIGGSWEAR